jgi:hypothetical protein
LTPSGFIISIYLETPSQLKVKALPLFGDYDSIRKFPVFAFCINKIFRDGYTCPEIDSIKHIKFTEG